MMLAKLDMIIICPWDEVGSTTAYDKAQKSR